MNNIRGILPGMFTMGNLACGFGSIVISSKAHGIAEAMRGRYITEAVWLIVLAAFFDYLDGMVARFSRSTSRIGVELDSLADMVSFGVLPGVFIYTIFKTLFLNQVEGSIGLHQTLQWIMLGSVLVVPAFSAIRLARFNVREPEGPFFQGLPAPAHALFWTGLFWQFMQDGLLFGTPLNIFFMWAIMLIMAFHMILPVPMYTLKFEHFRIRGNLIRYILIAVSVTILLFTGLSGLSLVILTYILLSLLNLLLQSRVSR